MMRQLYRTVIALLSIGIGCVGQSSCPAVSADAPFSQLVSFLSNANREDASNACIVDDIEQIESKIKGNILRPDETATAIQVLIRYIDYERELSPAEKQGYVFQPRISDYLYPATDALLILGPKAVPSLVFLLSLPTTSMLAHKNALYTLMAIYRNKPREGVRIILAGANTAPDTDSAKRLHRVAEEAVQQCGSSHRAECEAELKPKEPSS